MSNDHLEYDVYRVLRKAETTHCDHACYCWVLTDHGIEEPDAQTILITYPYPDPEDETQQLLNQLAKRKVNKIAEYLHDGDKQHHILAIKDAENESGKFQIITTRIDKKEFPRGISAHIGNNIKEGWIDEC